MKRHLRLTNITPARETRRALILTSFTAALSVGAGVFDTNLIQNSGAEDSPGSIDGSFSPPSAWAVVGSFSAVQYGAASGFPDNSTQGSPSRGANFFAGGPDNEFSSASQLIDVSTEATLIDTGTVQYSLSGWIGGWNGQNDNLTITARFYGAGNQELGSASIGPVFTTDRGNTTSFLFRDDSGLVPTDTRTIQVLLEATRTEGLYNDGYADDLSLTLKATPVPEPETYAAFVGLGLGAFAILRRRQSKTRPQ